jgi:hypothetical protein
MSRSTVRRDAARRSVLYQPKSDTNRTLFALLHCHICQHYITTILNVRCRGAAEALADLEKKDCPDALLAWV